MSKPSDLIPELQGRFPIRVELESLGASEFEKILTQPENALIKQYVELMKTEDVTLVLQTMLLLNFHSLPRKLIPELKISGQDVFILCWSCFWRRFPLKQLNLQDRQ